MRDLTSLGWVAIILLLIGGLNWGLIGLFDVNLVAAIFGVGLLARLVYIIVGVAAGYIIYLIYLLKFKKVL